MPNRKLNRNEAMIILNKHFMKGGGKGAAKLPKKKPQKTFLKANWCEMSTDRNCIPRLKK